MVLHKNMVSQTSGPASQIMLSRQPFLGVLISFVRLIKSKTHTQLLFMCFWG